MTTDDPAKAKKRPLWLAVAAAVAAAHLAVFAALSIGHPLPPPVASVVEVTLFRLTPPPPSPPPLPVPKPKAGGGAPAAPSRIHVAPVPPAQPRPIPPPPKPAPVTDVTVGLSDQPSPTPGSGQGGQGTGTGTGNGDGDGPGSGGAPALILRGASQSEILALVPPAARAARRAGRSSVNCVIRSDTRLEDCRIVSETPPGLGFGEAALRIAPTYFRFRPPTTASGRAIEGYRVTVFVQFGRQ